jgi:hypothetical protein
MDRTRAAEGAPVVGGFILSELGVQLPMYMREGRIRAAVVDVARVMHETALTEERILLGQTYIFFGAWGDFFHLFFSYFLWNLGIFVEISSGNGRNGRNGRIVTAVT